jgi:hypothetical protein
MRRVNRRTKQLFRYRHKENVTVSSISVGTFEEPDEVRTPDKTTLEALNLGGAKVGRMTLEPGWTWEECVKPIVGGESCQARHVGLVQSGELHVVHNDGTEADLSPGSVYVIEPGHNAWVVGDEPVVGYEFDTGTVETYASAPES